MVDTMERTKSAQEIREHLEAPFEAHEIKQRQGAYNKMLSYIDGPTVYRRLNEACNSWDFVVNRSYFDDMIRNAATGEMVKVMIVEGHLTIPELGTRAGTGVQVLSPGSGEDMYKGARTDAIKNAASLFGVGLDLYDSGAPLAAPQQQYNNDYAPANSRQQLAPPPQYGGQQQAPQQGQFQKATGDRVPGGATVKQTNAIKAIANTKGMDDLSLIRYMGMNMGINADETAPLQDALDQLNSRAASGVIEYLNSL